MPIPTIPGSLILSAPVGPRAVYTYDSVTRRVVKAIDSIVPVLWSKGAGDVPTDRYYAYLGAYGNGVLGDLVATNWVGTGGSPTYGTLDTSALQ
jgi:hypothetical protein